MGIPRPVNQPGGVALRRARGRRWLGRTAALLALSLLPPLAGSPLASASAAPQSGGLGKPAVPKPHVSKVGVFKSQVGMDALARARKARAANDAQAATARDQWATHATWPTAGNTLLHMPATGTTATGTAGTLPISITRPNAKAKTKAPAASPSQVRVQVLDHSAAEKAGVNGVLFTAAPDQAGIAHLAVDYSAFASAYGGGWSGRLHLVQLPACAATTPGKADCRQQTQLHSANNAHTHQVSADLSLGSAPTRATAIPQSAQQQPLTTAATPTLAVFALTATTGTSSSGAGTYAATSLGASSTWEAGGSSGSFTWDYPLRTPPAAAGPSPSLSISYDSGSIDGQTANTNNQGTQVGEGFDLTSSYITRTYGSCDDDGQSGKYDLCWKYDNASLVLNGKASELVKDDTTGEWRLNNDDASQVIHGTGADNGAHDGEYWTVITGDGTKYVFGQHKLPGWSSGDPVTNSVWTAPVYGDDTGEPCHGSDFASSACDDMGWRWNLDYVVDLHGNAMAYFYDTETNYYAKNGDDSPTTAYTRGGTLKEIRYGLRTSDLFSTGDANGGLSRVTFDYAERCLAADCSSLTKDTAANWPDVPFDAICDKDKTCTNQGPSFFTRERLTGVHTWTWDTRPATDASLEVDSWTLKQKYLDPGDIGDSSDQTMVLDSIQHTGKAGSGLTLDPVTFTYQDRPNRVDATDDILPLTKPRIYTITSETGAVTTVNFSDPECVRSALPTPDANTASCYPVYWNINGSTDPQLDWFHKYRVTNVLTADPTGHAPTIQNHYAYSGGGAWHYSDDPFTAEKNRTWSIWRGYGQVTTTTGASSVQSKSVAVYLRGMDGDRQVKDDGTLDTPRSVSVTGIKSGAITDKDQYAGFLREKVIYDGANEVSGTVNTPWSQQTAVQHKSYADIEAYMVRTSATQDWTRITSGTPHDRTHTVTTTFDDYGMADTVDDAGDDAVTGDETCTTTWYARNDTIGLTNLVSRTRKTSKPCSTADTTLNLPADSTTPGDVVSDTATVYDNPTATAWTPYQTPTLGEATWTGRATAYPATATGGERNPTAWQTTSRTTVLDSATSKYVPAYDALGRPTSVTDAAGNTTATAYTPTAAGPLTKTVVTNAKTQKITTLFDPFWGVATKTADVNSKVTEQAYDPLGRLTDVWLPNRSHASGQNPNTHYAYGVTADNPSWVSTGALKADGSTYQTSYQIYDALLRPLQTQAPSPQGGRVINDTRYDDRGLATEVNSDVYDNTTAPSGIRMGVQYGQAPTQTETVFDGAARPTTVTTYTGGVQRWSTTTTYTGDSTATTALAGGSATRVFTDALGRTTERREYKGTDPNAPGAAYTSTGFTYTPAGQSKTVTGPDGSAWSYTYDLLGRQVSATDPDKGITTTGYTTLDQISWTKDADGRTLAYKYDELGRKTDQYNNTDQADTHKLAHWAYDTLAKGQLDSSTRYIGGTTGQAYQKKVTTYDALYRPLDTQLILPATDALVTAGVPSTLAFETYYNLDGTVQYTSEPAVAGLPAEDITTTYNSFGLPATVTGTTGYLLAADYSQYGEVNQLTLGPSSANGTKKTYITNTYEDGTRRLTESNVTDQTHAYMLQDLNYHYDDAGNVTSVFDPTTLGGTSQADNQCFAYDGYRRLTDAWTPKTADCSTTGRTTANLAGAGPYWTSWAYNDAGLRTSEKNNTTAVTTTYCYGTTTYKQPHALAATTTAASPNCATLTPTYDYDKTGNTTKRPDGTGTQALSWSEEGKLTELKKTTGTTVNNDTSYIYDTDGNLLIRRPTNTSGNGETVLYLGATEVHYTVNGTTKKLYGLRYYTTGGQTIAVRTNQTGTTVLSYLAGDQHGTASLTVDATTQAITKRYTTPFGAPRTGGTGTWPDDKRFLGKPADTTTSLTHIGAREYDPATGRFLSVDPLLTTNQTQSLNGYTYANNNPTTSSDPTGLFAGPTYCLDTCTGSDSPQAAPGSQPGGAHHDDVSSGGTTQGGTRGTSANGSDGAQGGGYVPPAVDSGPITTSCAACYDFMQNQKQTWEDFNSIKWGILNDGNVGNTAESAGVFFAWLSGVWAATTGPDVNFFGGSPMVSELSKTSTLNTLRDELVARSEKIGHKAVGAHDKKSYTDVGPGGFAPLGILADVAGTLSDGRIGTSNYANAVIGSYVADGRVRTVGSRGRIRYVELDFTVQNTWDWNSATKVIPRNPPLSPGWPGATLYATFSWTERIPLYAE